MNMDHFCSHLASTVQWCRSRVSTDDPKFSLRSNELKPSAIMSFDDLSAIHEVVASVIARRDSILGPVEFDARKMDGRLFGFYPRHTISDGVSEIETNGFIDGTNTPPWDTWICMVDELLISWIPPSLIESAEIAIVCNAEGCIAWLSDLEREPFVKQLRQNQLLF